MLRNLMSRRTAVIILMSILLLIVIGAIAIRQMLTVPQATTVAEIETGGWHQVNLGDDVISADGSDFYMWVRKGNSNNLIVHFQGGGLAWDVESAASPITNWQILGVALTNNFDNLGHYTNYVNPIILTVIGGIFDFENEQNPFKEWNVIYVPYSTGDLFMGTTSMQYKTEDGETFTIYHNGAINAQAALDWAFDNFENPDKILVSGASAGAFGSAVWVEPVAEHYSDAAVYQLSDGFFAVGENIDYAIRNYWKADIQERFGFKFNGLVMEDVIVSHLEEPLPNVKFLHSHTTRDVISSRFYARLNGLDLDNRQAYLDEWSNGMKASVERVLNTELDYNLYLTDYRLDPDTKTTPHVVLEDPLFYETEEEGILYFDWLKSNVIDDEPLSVGLELLAAE